MTYKDVCSSNIRIAPNMSQLVTQAGSRETTVIQRAGGWHSQENRPSDGAEATVSLECALFGAIGEVIGLLDSRTDEGTGDCTKHHRILALAFKTHAIAVETVLQVLFSTARSSLATVIRIVRLRSAAPELVPLGNGRTTRRLYLM